MHLHHFGNYKCGFLFKLCLHFILQINGDWINGERLQYGKLRYQKDPKRTDGSKETPSPCYRHLPMWQVTNILCPYNHFFMLVAERHVLQHVIIPTCALCHIMRGDKCEAAHVTIWMARDSQECTHCPVHCNFLERLMHWRILMLTNTPIV